LSASCSEHERNQQLTALWLPMKAWKPLYRSKSTRTDRMADDYKMIDAIEKCKANRLSSRSEHIQKDYEDDGARDETVFDDIFSISIENDGQTISISTRRKNLDSDYENSSEHSWDFLSPLLWVNDPRYIHATSGQRLRSLGQYSNKFAIVRAQIFSMNQVSFDDVFDDTCDSTMLYPFPPKGSMHSRGDIYSLFTDIYRNIDEKKKRLVKLWWNYGETSVFDLEWLVNLARNNCLGRSLSSKLKGAENTVEASLRPRRSKERSRMTTAVTKDIAMGAIDNPKAASISKFDYKETMENEDTLYEAMRDIFEHGAILIQNAPDVGEMTKKEGKATMSSEDDVNSQELLESIVRDLGQRFSGGSLSHGSLYGDIFHVKSKYNAENIAYTNVALPPHQDLTYYESKPFLQLLHCATVTKNNSNYIVGGESVLIDGMAAAEELRRIAPDVFNVLLNTEATFVKERHDADMVSPKPHIVVDRTYGQVVEFNWSPPFEGPLQINPSVAVEDYVRAYQALEIMVDNNYDDDMNCEPTLLPPSLETLLRDYAKKYTWERTLQAGEILVFNNQRMLHGRRSFNCFGTVQRHLIGCYTDAIDTASQYRQLLRNRGWKSGGGYGRRNPGSGCRWM